MTSWSMKDRHASLIATDGTYPMRCVVRAIVDPASILGTRSDGKSTYLLPCQIHITHIIFCAYPASCLHPYQRTIQCRSAVLPLDEIQRLLQIPMAPANWDEADDAPPEAPYPPPQQVPCAVSEVLNGYLGDVIEQCSRSNHRMDANDHLHRGEVKFNYVQTPEEFVIPKVVFESHYQSKDYFELQKRERHEVQNLVGSVAYTSLPPELVSKMT